MSDAKKRTQTVHGGRVPRAIVHKKILDAAETRPNASIEKLATMVDGASEQLVERVLDQYGDPATVESDGEDDEQEQETGHQSLVAKADEDTDVDETQTSNQPSTTTDSGEAMKEEATANSGTNAASDDSVEEDNQQKSQPTNGDSVQQTQSDSGLQSEQSTTESSSEGETFGADNQFPRDENTVDIQPDESGELESSMTETTALENSTAKVDNDASVPEPTQLTAKQREVLQAIHDNPYATQSELAEQFDVSRATISQRVNSIDGFDWTNRKQFVEKLAEEHDMIERNNQSESHEEVAKQIEELSERITSVEEMFREMTESTSCPFESPELASKVIRACIESERVTEDEEEQIIAELIGYGSRQNAR